MATAGALALLAMASGALAAPGVAQAAPVGDQQWYLSSLQISQAQQISNGAGVIVAVVDTGVDASHPDLQGQVLPGTGFGPDASADGRTDTDGHGTGMAGIIAAKGGDAFHVLGIAPKAKILPVATGPRTVDNIAQGIHWAVDHGAKVINISEGPDEPPSSLTTEAVRYALSHNVVVVSSAGNHPLATNVIDPADVPGVIAVSATDQSGQLWSGSCTGPQVVLSAPGVNIVNVDIPSKSPSGYGSGTGTSASSAIVAGVAALIFAKYPNITAANVINRLIRTAKDLGTPGRDPQYGFGLVDPVAALTANVPDVSQNPLVSSSAGSSPTAAGAAPTKTDNGFPIAIGVTNKAGAIIQVVLCLAVVVGLIVLIVYLRRRSRRAAAARAAQVPPGWGPPGAQPGWPPQPPTGTPFWHPQGPGTYPGQQPYGGHQPPGPPAGGGR
jgi:type VII secretion-associated serine protease mycosin